MELIINGTRQRVKAHTIPALLAELGFEGNFYAVAINERLVPRSKWQETKLQEQDRIEIVTPRQGG